MGTYCIAREIDKSHSRHVLRVREGPSLYRHSGMQASRKRSHPFHSSNEAAYKLDLVMTLARTLSMTRSRQYVNRQVLHIFVDPTVCLLV